MTPHHLHALAAAWSLHTARQTLAEYAADEAAQIAAEALEAPSVLRSTVYGARFGSGGHSDPTPAMLAVADRPARRNRWQEMADRATGKLAWLADQLPTAPAGPDPWWRLYDALPRLQAGTAAVVTRHLVDEDAWIRNATGLAPDRQPLAGVDCPACGTRALYVQTAGPRDVWTVVCAADCRCTGQGCRCGQLGAVEGVAHIWPRHVVLGAVAGAAPTTTTRED